MTLELAVTDEGSGDAIVLLHAFPCNRHMWDAQIEALAAAGYRVIAPDLPGFGDSAVSAAAPDLAVVAQLVFDLIDDRALGQVAVAGLSMGGYVAMEMLRQQPGRINALGLVDTKATADPDEARQGRLQLADAVVAAGSSAALLDMMPKLLGETSRAERPPVVEAVTTFINEAHPEAVAWAQRAMAARPDSLADLARFAEPALVAYGVEDVLTPVAEQDSMAGALPDGVVAPIPGVGHLSALEAPAEVSAVLIDLLGRI